MNQSEAKQLGNQLRRRRDRLGLSVRALALKADITPSTLWRLEAGVVRAPEPRVLIQVSEALGLSSADIFALAGYVTPSELPSFMLYLRAKYPRLPGHAVDQLSRVFTRLAAPY